VTFEVYSTSIKVRMMPSVDKLVGFIGAVGALLVLVQGWGVYVRPQCVVGMFLVYSSLFVVPTLAPRFWTKHRITYLGIAKLLVAVSPAGRQQFRLNRQPTGSLVMDCLSALTGGAALLSHVPCYPQSSFGAFCGTSEYRHLCPLTPRRGQAG
jgi:hypothetical protein